MNIPGSPVFLHLAGLTDDLGIVEHARFASPRARSGYTSDDVARALVVTAAGRSPELDRMTIVYLRFLERAIREDGLVHNRMGRNGTWRDRVGSGDCHGRVLWSLATVATGAVGHWSDQARELYGRVAPITAPDHLRPHALAMLGAAKVIGLEPDRSTAESTLRRGVAILQHKSKRKWPWPEDRLTYGNARLPGALIAAGEALADEALLGEGLDLLEWLVATETRDGHFSFVPVGGWAPGEIRPGFDQQPIEAAAMADACYLAWKVTGESAWADLVERAGRWFLGENDLGVPLYDPETGAGFDGLGPAWVNRNRGAESTISALTALQLWGSLESLSAASSARSETRAAPTA
jgi:hypothetical protein